VKIVNDPDYSPGSADNIYFYQQEHFLSGINCPHVNSLHAVRVFEQSIEVSSCILLAEGVTTEVHDNSAVMHNDVCVVAVGPYMVALSIPTLEIQWVTIADEYTCFGVFHSVKHKTFISHGENEIARVTYDGKIVWHKGGADIFSGKCHLEDDKIIVHDFDDRRYIFDVGTGRELSE